MKGIKEHYVPQFYLKNFGDRIYLYDKQTRKISQSTPKNVAFKRNFYADSNDSASKLEDVMSQFEGDANTILSKIIKTKSVAQISNTERTTLNSFVAFQFARTPEFKNWSHDMIQSAMDMLNQTSITDKHIEEQEGHAKSTHLASILDYIGLAGPRLHQMRIYLLKNDTGIPFWTSDNPVVRDNNITGKLGAGSPGVEFYLPLSPTIMLGFYDDTCIDLMDDTFAADGVSEEHRVWALSNIPETVNVVKQNVIRANHLQTRFSTRFVFSDSRHFHMMEEFLDADGDYKKRSVFHGPVEHDSTGNTENRLNMGRNDVINHQLQNALDWYRKAKREADMYRAFTYLCTSLEMVTHLCWDKNILGEGFDDRVRELIGDPALSLDRFRHIYNSICNSEYPDMNLDKVQMDKDVVALRQITAKAIQGRIEELQGRD